MQTREVEALERWIVEYGDAGTSEEGPALAARLDALMRTADGDELENWDYLIHVANRIGRRGSTPAARAAARMLVGLVEGDPRVIDAILPAPVDAEPPRVRRPVNWRVVGLATGVLAAAFSGGAVIARSVLTPSLTVVGPASGAQIGAAAVRQLAFLAPGSPARLDTERWTFDGRNVTREVVPGVGALVYHPTRLADGPHELDVSVGGGFLGSSAIRRFKFDVDLAPPALAVTPVVHGLSWHPVLIHGTVASGTSVRVAGRPVALEAGEFTALVQPPVPGIVPVTATDAAGNTTLSDVTVVLRARRPVQPIRAVHVTAAAWADPTLHRGVMALVNAHRVNTLEIDLKDEGGVVGFGGVPAANAIGATHDYYNLAATIRLLHAKGIRVIGRLVCFRDPIAANAAWKAGRRSEVVQTPTHGPYSGYGGFTNFASPAVRQYEIAIAVAAARDGIDEVLYDYVRRPDGPVSSMYFPGLETSPSKSIVGFLHETRLALKPYGTYLGASVFGIAATRPDQVGQDIPAMARQLDYVSPMVYPSAWNNGEYDVPNPNEQPYEIVKRVLVDFRREVAGTGARLVPWLQDFSLGVSYGAKQVKEQIAAEHADGIDEYLLWNPDVVYDAGGLTPNARPEVPLRKPLSETAPAR